MIKLAGSAVLVCLLLTPLPIQGGVQDSPQSSYIGPVQLKGLKSFLLYVYIDPSIPNSAEITDCVKARATGMFAEAGLSLDDKQRATLAVEVDLYPLDLPIFVEYTMAQISVSLLEEVRLLRKPSLKKSIAAVTWHMNIFDTLLLSDVRAFIKKRTEDLIRLFLSDLMEAEDRNFASLGHNPSEYKEPY